MIAMNKGQLRRHIRALDQGQEERASQSKAICRHIIDSKMYAQARIVGGYMPLQHEADVLPVLMDVLNSGRMLALPLCGPAPHMTLRVVSSFEELQPGAYGIMEPTEDAPVIQPDELDMLLVPLEGIDTEGYRLGKGKGYYDCLLSYSKITTIGCAFSWQKVDAVPRDAWDKPLFACADCSGLCVYERNKLYL